jgi:tetratricopeptide (TPR) repeat protein
MSAQETAQKRHIDAHYIAAVKDFEAAVRHFQKQKFDKAKEIFEKLVSSPALEVAARARVHLQLCEQKLGAAERAPAAKTAENYYNLGVMELNARSLDQAVEHLSKADKLAPNQEHIRYVLAAAHALQGNTNAALEHLSAAISLRPGNRIRARRDEDFRLLASDPRFKQLISG